ncbi:unnamed protein product, partial [Mesorhabditis belari]|uniref:WAPL domain-containing protein n=1 Tax=Mesorhabditis belari TaxID=2138241 RepID=A0AAF3F5W2_9BILA
MSTSGGSRGKLAQGFGTNGADQTAASLFDSVFSKPANRFPKRPVLVEEEKDALPSVVSEASTSRNLDGNQKMMSPPVSLPESTSTEGDGNVDQSPSGSNSDDDDTMDSQHSSGPVRRPPKHTLPISSNYEFDDNFDEDSNTPPASKRAKSPEEEPQQSLRLLPKKEAKPIYRHTWSTGSGPSDEEQEEPNETREDSPEVAKTANVENNKLLAKPRVPIWRSQSAATTATIQKDEGVRRIRKVKEAHECLEIGEQDDYKQDLEYILSSLANQNANINTKCLSAITLAKKCITSDFRQFIRTKGLIGAVFRSLIDAPSDANFALCAATVVYLMCRDHISVKADATTLRLLSSLLKMETGPLCQVDEKYKKQVHDIFKAYVKNSESTGHKIAFDIDLENISPSSLVLEALVYVLSKNHEEAVKNELLTQGALQWVVTKVEKITQSLEESQTNETAQKLLIPLERCFRVLEMCTLFHKKNQAYLISHRGSVLINSCAKLIALQQERVSRCETNSELAYAHLGCLSMMARVLMNLSHENELCCTKLGQIPGFLPLCLSSFTYIAPKYAADDKKFDLYVMMCSLLVNLVERCNSNRRKLIGSQIRTYDPVTKEETELPVLEALTKLFLSREEAAKNIDEDLDKDLVMEEPDMNENDNEENDDDDGPREDGRLDRGRLEDMSEAEMLMHVQSAMNKASAHMEDSVVASYVALLIGCLLQQNEEAANRVRELLPDGRLDSMIEQLHRFLEFMNIASSNKGCRSIEKIVEYLERMNSE